MIGETLGHYRILQKIGAGGMGEVYRARDQHLNRDVAIKVLPVGTLPDEAARKRFRKEAEVLSKLNHPNIATVFDFDTQDGTDFLAMEYIPGSSLSEKLAAGPLSEKEIVRCGEQLAEGLAAAHTQGVLHRDLKPGNLRLTPDGRVKILDFGLAKLFDPASETVATVGVLTETQPLAGTLPYMSPEQLRGEKVNARTDIYAVGVVLYEMATGRRPFENKLSTALAAAILHREPTPPRQVNSQVSPALENIILKALDKDPDRRYQSARDLKVDLERLSAGQPVLAAPRRAWRLRQWPALAAAFLVLAFLALISNLGGLRERLLGGAGAAGIRSLAVLPLENLSGDPEQEYFADGMTEALTTELAQIHALKVISRTSAMQYRRAHKPLPQIARELRVDAVVEGSVQREGQRVRVTAQLIHAPTDASLWAESYERDLGDVLGLQSEVARAIAREIQVKLTPQEEAHLASSRRVNPEAHEAYLKGRYYWNRYEYQKALQSFQNAIRVEPGYAAAYVGLADAYYGLSGITIAPSEAVPRSRAAALKALELDDSLAEAYSSVTRKPSGKRKKPSSWKRISFLRI